MNITAPNVLQSEEMKISGTIKVHKGAEVKIVSEDELTSAKDVKTPLVNTNFKLINYIEVAKKYEEEKKDDTSILG